MLSKRENALEALAGRKTEYTPCYFDSCQTVRGLSSKEAPPMGTVVGLDGWGCSQTSCAEAGGMFTATVGAPPVIDDVTLWKEQATFPQWEEAEVAALAEKEKALFGYDKENYVQDMFAGKGMFERFHFMRGFEDALCDMLIEEEAVYDLVGAIADKKIEYLKLASKYYDLDYYTYMDDYGHQTGQFMSMDTFRRIFKPHYQRIIDETHKLGIKFKTHSCGLIQPFLDEFLEMGIDALDPVQPINDVPAMLQKTIGKIGISGGLDVQHIIDRDNVTEEEIRAEVRRCIDQYGANGGYMIYGASLYMYDPERMQEGKRIRIICDEAENYGGYRK